VTCGTCKWLEAEPRHRKKDGTVKKTHDYSVFVCSVPFDPPAIPACFEVQAGRRRLMAPVYGAGCSFHEPVKK
jgi:hypothetical protein